MAYDVLNSEFGIEGIVEVVEGPGGMAMVRVTNDLAEADIMLQGAHLVHWQPAGQKEVIWVSEEARFEEGKSIRGGIPVCWPWFGPHETEADYPAHGFARMVPWNLVKTEHHEDGSTSLEFTISDTHKYADIWLLNLEVRYRITVGARLTMELISRNHEQHPVNISEALHTYFAVDDVRAIEIQGLEDRRYLDKVDEYVEKIQQGPVTIAEEVDRVYQDTQDSCVIFDPLLARRIRIETEASHSTIVWNPWIEKGEAMGDLGKDGYLRMLCVESGNALENQVEIPKGGSHCLKVMYTVESLPV